MPKSDYLGPCEEGPRDKYTQDMCREVETHVRKEVSSYAISVAPGSKYIDR